MFVFRFFVSFCFDIFLNLPGVLLFVLILTCVRFERGRKREIIDLIEQGSREDMGGVGGGRA